MLASSFTVDSDSQLTAVVPQGATSGPISVTTPGGSATSTSNFTVTPTPPPPPPTTTTTTAYYGGGLAESVNGVLSYLLSDPTLGSASASVNLSGAVTASQLYAPYGAVRYSSGILPTDYGFTHQRSDATTGLDDYGARWYDPEAGQFMSADTTLAGGLNRYASVAGNPETLVDPSGHEYRLEDDGVGGGIDGGQTSGASGGGGSGDGSGDTTTSSSGDPTADPVISQVSVGHGDTEITYTGTGDSFVTDGQGDVVGAVDETGQIETNAQIEAQQLADETDRLNQGEQPRERQGNGDRSGSATEHGEQGFPSDQQHPYDPPKGKATFGQEYADSCVAACGRMILNDANVQYYGGTMPEGFVRDAAGVQVTLNDPTIPAGANTGNLATAVPSLGGPPGTYVSDGTLADLQDATDGGQSAVAALTGHAVVVDGVTSDVNPQVLIRDPADGGDAYSVSATDFLQRWSGRFVRFD